MNLCNIDNCNKKIHSRGLCNKHYRRLQRNGFENLSISITRNSDLTEIQKFHKLYSVDSKNNCWEWKNSVNNNGYGRIMINGKRIMAHVWSYKLNKGDISDGLLVCHHCDNPRCVNPSHLFLGTHADNLHDYINKYGHKDSKVRINTDDVIEIKKDLQGGKSVNEICDLYEILPSRVYHIKNGITWNSLSLPIRI